MVGAFTELTSGLGLSGKKHMECDLKNASYRLGMPKAADITKARALATRRGKHLKLNISYGHELINWEMSVYFDNIGLVLQLSRSSFMWS